MERKMNLGIITTRMAVTQCKSFENMNSNKDNLAIYLRGVVIADIMPTRQCPDLEACLISFVPGIIRAYGEKRERIYSAMTVHDTESDFEQRHSPDQSLKVDFNELALKPFNAFPTLEVLPRVELSGVNLSASFDILVDGQLLRTNLLFPTWRTLANLYVTESCEHDYYDEYLFQPPEKKEDAKCKIQSIHQGLWVLGNYPGKNLDISLSSAQECYIHMVDQNTNGQWIACMNADLGPDVVLQRNACFKCVCTRYEQYLKNCDRRDWTFYDQLFIICGRFEGKKIA